MKNPVLRTLCTGLVIVSSLNGTAGALRAGSPSPKRPNVVILVADDMGWGDVGYHGSEIKTPNLDKLVAEGVELDRFYAFPVCSPTRAAMMTGRSPLRFGITAPLGRSRPGPPLDERFLPQSFRAAGYQTLMSGKWHLGGADGELPQERGFDHFYGFVGGVTEYYTRQDGRRGRGDWQRNGERVSDRGYSTDLLAAEAIRLLRERDRKKPVFLYLPFNAPHTPLQAPEAVIEKYRSIEGRDRRVYAAMVDAMDAAIGRVLSALDDEGLGENTLVLFFSDNGGSRSGGASNRPLTGVKLSVFEGGIRVPAVMRWPGVLEAGRKSRQVVSVIDLLPTLTSAAGIEAGNTKPLDGQDVWPAIRDGKEVAHVDVVFGDRQQSAVLHGSWKLVRTSRSGGEPQSRLYRIGSDPTEETNLASEHPDVVRDLGARIEKLTSLLPERRDDGRRRSRRGGFARPRNPLLIALDLDGDGEVSAAEIAGAPAALKKLDANADGRLSDDELPRALRSGSGRGGRERGRSRGFRDP